MNLEDYECENSDTDDSDFNPLGAEDSGEESIDEKYEGKEYEDRAEGESENKSKKKRKKTKNKGRTTRNTESPQKEEERTKPVVDSEAEKKRIDALFADFMSGTSSEISQPASSSSSKKIDIPKVQQQQPQPVKTKAPSPVKIFEFAGETIEITNSQNEQSSANSAASKSSNPPTSSAAAKRPAGSGLSSVLNQLGKKGKLSVLEKTKLDWDGFKSKEGINEELKTHNRGRDGFLERRDFLERTDLRQFEIEKGMRSVSRRSNK